MQPSFTITLHKSNIHWVPISPVACIISATSPDKSGALGLFILFNAAATSSILMQSAGPSLTQNRMSTNSHLSPKAAKLTFWSAQSFGPAICSFMKSRSTFSNPYFLNVRRRLFELTMWSNIATEACSCCNRPGSICLHVNCMPRSNKISTHMNKIHTVFQNKHLFWFLVVTSENVDHFQNSFIDRFPRKFSRSYDRNLNFNYVATLPCEIWQFKTTMFPKHPICLFIISSCNVNVWYCKKNSVNVLQINTFKIICK